VALRVPVVIMVVAVLMALVSLFVVAWGRPPLRPAPGTGLTATSTVQDGAIALSDVALADATGARVQLDSLFPAVIILVDRCACLTLVRDVARTAPPELAVVVVGRRAPESAGVPGNVRTLADPTDAIRSRFPAPSATGATAIMVDGSGRVIATVLSAHTGADLGPLAIG
jgi:hypothetical protein